MGHLNNDMRESIAARCVNAQFAGRVKDIQSQEHDLAMECYRSIFDPVTLRTLKKVPTEWLSMDKCLRFNVGGYDLRLNVNEPVPVPYATHCSRLGSITGELAERVQAHANTKSELNSEAEKAKHALKVMLAQFRDVKKLQKAWPEGQPFYEIYLGMDAKSGVPAVQIDQINAMLGLKKAA